MNIDMEKKKLIIIGLVVCVVSAIGTVAFLENLSSISHAPAQPAGDSVGVSELRERAIERVKRNEKESAQEYLEEAITKAERDNDYESVVELEQQLDWASMEPDYMSSTDVQEITPDTEPEVIPTIVVDGPEYKESN